MEGQINCTRLNILLALFISTLATTSFSTSEATRLLQMMESNGQEEFRTMEMNDESYGPFSLAPMESSLPPLPLHDQTTPPFCVYPPFMLPPPPSTTNTTPSTTMPPPPPSTTMPSPPPSTTTPLRPPSQLPPTFPTQSPPPRTATPPSPPLVFQPPVVHPPPSASPQPHKRVPPEYAVWCVAKAHVPNPIIQEALDYACGSGADCDSIKLNGSCYLPNTLIAHASFAFNSYWQRTKVTGGTCDFGGTAMLVTVDPSYDGCHFIYN